jgi:hypothetical protein
MPKLEILPQFVKLYGEKLNPDLESFKYCQDSKDAFVEMLFKGGKTLVENLKFIDDGKEDEHGNYIPKLAYDPSDDIVDNATKLIEMDSYSLINCITDLFSTEAELVISNEFHNIDN